MSDPLDQIAHRRAAGPADAVAGGDAPSGVPTWRFTILGRLTNHPLLRRHLGRPRAEALMGDIAARIGAVLPDGSVIGVGRDLIEIELTGRARGELDQALGSLDAAFEQPVNIDGEPHRLDLAFGAAAAPAPHHDPVRLIEEAERALADAEAERRPVARQVSTAIDPMDRLTLARELHQAIERGELFLQYQPKLHIRRQSIASVEALIRWRHPVRGLVLPGDFIPLAEESSAIVALTLWIIRQVIMDQRRLALRGHDLPVFINIAGVLLGDPRFVRRACAMVQEGGARIGFEITETSVIRDPDSAIANLKAFADVGIPIAIDDYGAGLSSLAYLKRLPARELKIDKLFVTQLTSSHRDPLIVRSTIDLAHAMEMEVVAEGVETQAALALLSVMGCDMAQGYLISRPIGFEALLGYLDEDRHLSTPQDPQVMLGRLSQVWRTG